MGESKLQELELLVDKFKKDYETAKKEREAISDRLNKIDDKVLEYEQIFSERNFKKEKYKENFNALKIKVKKIIKNMCSFVAKISVLSLIINAITKNFHNYPKQLLIMFITSACIYIPSEIVITCIERKNKKQKRYTKKEIKEAQKQYHQILSERLQLGLEYKKIRENELELYERYETAKKNLDEYLNEMEKVEDIPFLDIDLSDIYHKIKVDFSFYEQSKEMQQKIFDDKLREYIIEKICLNQNKFKKEILEKFTTEELVEIIVRLVSNEKKEQLNHLIHAVIGFAGNMQNCCIVWYEESDSKLIDSPQVIVTEDGKWDKLITNKFTPHEVIFSLVYNTLMDEMKQNKSYNKKKQNMSNH